MSKRAWKLHEFVAHGNNVTSMALGRKSSRVMVTGSEDRKVNVWAVGNPKCIMSLQGHSSAVESVCFGNGEEFVVAGSASGAIKIWNLEQAKVVRTLTGHRANVKCIDCHPYGEFAATGAMDNVIKLWDLKRKGCIFNYKGHTDSINSVRFSPDGRWIVSASQDGTIKLWDLNAGKMLTELTQHTASVNWVEFHPTEFLLASASSDRTVKFWDLETFGMVDSSEPESNATRVLAFHPDGSCLYSGSQDQLRVHGWEPAQLYDSMNVGWGKVADCSITNNQLIGCSYNGSSVGVYVVDLQRVLPHGEPPAEPAAEAAPDRRSTPRAFADSPRKSARQRHQFERPATQSSRQQQYREEADDRVSPDQPEDDSSFVKIESKKDYDDVFHPSRTLARSPTRNTSPFQPPPDTEAPREARQSQLKQEEKKPKRQSSEGRGDGPKSRDTPVTSRDTGRSRDVPARDSPRSKEPSAREPARPRETGRAQKARDIPYEPLPEDMPVRQQRKPQQDNNEPNPEDFLQKARQADLPSELESSGEMSESEAIAMIMKGHTTMQSVLNAKCNNLQVVRALWTKHTVKEALDAAVNMHDPAIIVDLLNVINQKTTLWTLDIATLLMPHIRSLFQSKYDSYQQTACDSVKVVMNQFGALITGSVQAGPSLGVDITREERSNKCRKCYDELQIIRSLLQGKPASKSTLGSNFKQIKLLLDNLP